MKFPLRHLWRTALLALAAPALLAGCATGGDEYFLTVDSKANVYVAPVPSSIHKVAIMPFKAPTELIGSSVSDLLVTEMLRAGRYELVERSQMAKVLSESELALAGLSVEKAVQVGNMVGADGVIIGTVDEYGTVAYRGRTLPVVALAVRLIECRTGKVMWSADLAKRAETADIALSGEARVVVHEMTAGLYQKWGVQEQVAAAEPAIERAADSAPVPAAAAAPDVPPDRPPGFDLGDMGLREVSVTWSETAAGARRYRIERALAADGPFEAIAEVPAGAGEYRDAGTRLEPLADDTTYFYRLVALSDSGLESEPSEVRESMTAGPPEPPPSVAAEAPASRALRVTWAASPSVGIESYLVERAAADQPDRFVKVGETSKREFAEGGTAESPLADRTKYLYRITAVNRVGSMGPPSKPAEVTTRPPPAAVTGLAAGSGGVRCVPLSWAASPETDVVRYDLYRSDAADGEFTLLASIKGREKTTYLDGKKDPGDLPDDTTFHYRVRAVNAVTAEGENSETASATTRAAPPAVTGVTATPDRPREVPVFWVASRDDKVVGYDILRAAEGRDELAVVATVNGRGTVSWVDRGGAKGGGLGKLADGATYRYRVVAFNTARVGSLRSAQVEVRTKLAPAAPAGVSATTNVPKAVKLAWPANAEPDIKEYVVESRPAASTRFREVARGAPAEAAEAKLGDGERKVYRVKAVDQDGLESAWSDEVEGAAKPLPDAPADVAAEWTGDGALLTWTAPAQPDVVEYKVWKKGMMNATLLATVQDTRRALTAVEVGKKLAVQVSAVDADGLESARSAAAEVRPPAPAAP